MLVIIVGVVESVKKFKEALASARASGGVVKRGRAVVLMGCFGAWGI